MIHVDPHLQTVLQRRPVVLLGVGNPLRGDDAIGHLLAESVTELNNEFFHAQPVATSIENAMPWARKAANGALIVADAVFDESRPEGSWMLYPPDRLDSLCHTAHSIPLSLLFSFWQRDIPGLEIHFLGINIRSNAEMAPLSPPLVQALNSLQTLFRSTLSA